MTDDADGDYVDYGYDNDTDGDDDDGEREVWIMGTRMEQARRRMT